MAATPHVATLQAKSHDTPDETRTPPKTRVEVVRLEGHTIGRFTFEPGWRWSECVKPVVGTDSCQNVHLGYAVSGQIRVRMEDGTEEMIKAGDSYTIPPGHDAWVEGDETFVGIEVMSAEQYARPSPDWSGDGDTPQRSRRSGPGVSPGPLWQRMARKAIGCPR
jgi:quercetin dioxygenase-like cupin family protein